MNFLNDLFYFIGLAIFLDILLNNGCAIERIIKAIRGK